METEDKKLLVEKLMGLELVRTRNGGYSIIDLDVITPYFSLAKWNPDTNPEHFKEVWNKLTDAQQGMVIDECQHKNMISGNQRLFVNDVLNDLPKVCQAAVDVVKESK